ncbi:hypothetical protein NG825_08795 [Xanthomonas sacchari]|nr:hypothetical protein NG825_08795 [Xanthomonas sacchari]
MMGAIGRLFIFFVMIYSGGLQCQEKLLPPPPPQPSVLDENARSLDSGMVLDAVQINRFMIRAENGDGAAAYRLYSHFSSIDDKGRAKYWLLFAAVRGFPVAQYNMWFGLKDKTGCESKIAALAWLKSAAINGNLQASRKLKDFSMVEDECL